MYVAFRAPAETTLQESDVVISYDGRREYEIGPGALLEFADVALVEEAVQLFLTDFEIRGLWQLDVRGMVLTFPKRE